MRLPPALRGARAAVMFLTRVPVGGVPYSESDWSWVAAWTPMVGASIGLVLAGVWTAVGAAGPLAAASIVLAVSMMLTGAFHEDGLADTADALGGASERGRVLEILKDSRIGTFGAAALGASLLVRASLLARLGEAAPAALVVTQCLSRTPPVWLIAALPYVTDVTRAKSRPVSTAGAAQALFATASAAALAIGLAWGGWLAWRGVAVMAAVLPVLTVVAGWRFMARLRGITGDFLGATQQLAEAVLLLALVLA